MKKPSAGGPKTQSKPVRHIAGHAETHLDTQLTMLTDAMRSAFGRAEQSTRKDDEYGHFRSSEFDNAVRFAETSAHLVLALAKLQGEFHHNINVAHRSETNLDLDEDDDLPHLTREEVANMTTEEFWARDAELKARRTQSAELETDAPPPPSEV